METSETTSPAPKRRSGAVAGLFNFLMPGLGYLYLGRPWLALAFPAAIFVACDLMFNNGIPLVPIILLPMVLLSIAILLLAMISAILMARHQSPVPLKWFQRWYVYVIFFILANMLIESRLSWPRVSGYQTTGIAMADTLLPGERILVDYEAFTDKSPPPRRGDVVLFETPSDHSVFGVFRIVGLPLETLVIRDGVVQVNGEELVEPYATAAHGPSYPLPNDTFEVPMGAYFLLGDNRAVSKDSRYLGPIPAECILGKIAFVYWSYDSDEGIRYDRIGKIIR